MKQFILMAFMALTLTTQADVVKNVTSAAIEVADSTIKTVKDAAITLDTSALSKQIYSDVKAALVGFAAALKVGVEHVYGVLVKQQVVKAIQWTILGLIPILVFLIFTKPYWRYCQTNDKAAGGDDVVWFFWCIYIGLCGIGFIVGILHIDDIITGFVNPEYGAMTDIMSFIEKIRAK